MTGPENSTIQGGEPVNNRRYNRGEWAEVAVKCHFLINGEFLDGQTGLPTRFDKMEDGSNLLIPMTVNSSLYDIERTCAQERLKEGIELIERERGRSFENGPLMELCSRLHITRTKAHSYTKPDIVLIKGMMRSSYLIENCASAKSSFINASLATRITYVVTKDGNTNFTRPEKRNILEKYGKDANTNGHRKVKRRVQDMVRCGLDFKYHNIFDGDFKRHTERTGFTHFACICMDYLKTPGCGKVEEVLKIHRQHPRLFSSEVEFENVRRAFVENIRENILERCPTGAPSAEEVACSSDGMIFLIFLNRGTFKLYTASNCRWWEVLIAKTACFDTPDSKRHDYGYVYEDERSGELFFDYALGIRGAFLKLVREGMPR